MPTYVSIEGVTEEEVQALALTGAYLVLNGSLKISRSISFDNVGTEWVQFDDNQAKHFFRYLTPTKDVITLRRFSVIQIREMGTLFKVPARVILPNRSVVSGLDCLAMLLYRLSYPNRLATIGFFFGRIESVVSLAINWVRQMILHETDVF